VFDWNPYNATLAVLALGYRNVLWYRGGEEAWVAAGLKADDRRDP
jgi:rhodanese-related sulfurtransferase